MKKWIYPIKRLGEKTSRSDISPVVADLLLQRGIAEEAFDEYLSEKPQLTYDPFLLKGMKEACLRISEALINGEKICIYGDYDADGVTSVSLMLNVLGKLTDNLIYYIPSRFDEGYGLNREAMKTIRDQNVDLVITVDCGSVSYGEVEYAKELGLSVIVTDHHSIADAKAADCILINAKQEGCPYPFKELAGCGVAFKLVQALSRTLTQLQLEGIYQGELLTKSDLNHVLDLVAIATIGDIVPLVDENRTLVKYGMNRINGSKRYGLLELIKGTGLMPGKIKSDQVAYIIVPHLNAAGRMLSAKAGVELLTARNDTALGREKTVQAVKLLVKNNQERKAVQEETYQQCLKIVEEMHVDDHFLLINAGDAHEGIAGIVAGKIKDRYTKPVALVTNSGEEGLHLKGTGRSIEGVNLYELLAENRSLFEKFGGHAGACGFLLKKEYLKQLSNSLNTQVAKQLEKDPQLFVPKVFIDAVVEETELTLALIDQLEKLAPFGYRNEKPLLALEGLSLSKISYMGDHGQHVRFSGTGRKGVTHNFVLFGNAEDYSHLLQDGQWVDAVGYAGINEWNGFIKLQFVVQDLRESCR